MQRNPLTVPCEELIRNSDLLRLLIQVSEAIARHRDLTALCRDLADRLPAIVPFEFIALFLHDPEKRVMRVDMLGTADEDRLPPGVELGGGRLVRRPGLHDTDSPPSSRAGKRPRGSRRRRC